MQLRKILFIVFLLIFAAADLHAQNLTGTWEGDIIDNDEFLQVNIVQTGNRLCGYTWDYEYSNEKSYCKAYFIGSYDKAGNRWFLTGTSFIRNSGSHVLMEILFSIDLAGKRPVMNGFCRLKENFFRSAGEPSTIHLVKVSAKPAMMTQEMKDCIANNIQRRKPPATKPQKPVAPKPVAPKPAMPAPVVPKKKDSVVKIPVQPKIKDSIPVKPVLPVKEKLLPGAIPLQTAGRTNKETKRIIVTDKKITLNIYDNAEVDGDSISIYYNGRLIKNHIRLTDKPAVIELTLDENTILHTIVMYAENLGSIPPNTALMIFTDSKGKRYEIFSKATLQENAELIFEYRPE